MCCSVNGFSICKSIALIAGIILGVAVGLLVGFFPVLLTNAVTILWIFFGVALLLLVLLSALSVYVSDGGAGCNIASCICPLGTFATVLSVLSLAVTFVSLWIPLATFPILAAVLLGFVTLFFSALLISVVCIVICVINKACRG